MTKEPHSRRIKLKHLQINVHEWGSLDDNKPSIILLHASGFHGRCWDTVVKALGPYHIFAVDLRGHGLSDGPAFQDWSEFGEDIVELLLALELKKVVLVGHSLGGFTATYVAHQLPSIVSKLLLIDPVILAEQYFIDKVDMSHASRFSKNRTDSFDSPEDFYQRYKNKPPYSLFDDDTFRAYSDHALEWNEKAQTYRLACRPEFESSVYAGVLSYANIYPMIDKLEQKTYILRAMSAPSDDEFHGFQYSPTSAALAQRFKNATDFHLAKLTHFIPQQQPSLTAEYIERLIAD